MQDGLLTLMLQSVAGLAVVLSLFGLLVWMLKRLQKQRFKHNESTSIQVIQRCAIDAKHSVVELTHGRHTYLIGLSPTGMTAIANHTDGSEKDVHGDAE
ncbi:MAG: flagellar biosynthetic protein FliO [Mariprofundaceae bacterium]|nr:flagellar biosynthetic protein FliO [Mariprofundaceae bacterium]